LASQAGKIFYKVNLIFSQRDWNNAPKISRVLPDLFYPAWAVCGILIY
jgi:hypothetical protein